MQPSEFNRIYTPAYSIVCTPQDAHGPTIVDAVYLVYYRLFDGSIQPAGHAEDGTYLSDLGSAIASTSAGRSIFPDLTDPHGQGARIALDDDGRVLVLDYLNALVYAYQPPSPWQASPPMLVNGSLHWFEFELGSSAQQLPLRLMQSDVQFSEITVVRSDLVQPTIVIGEWGVAGRPSRGHDFTSSHAGIWVSWVDGNHETFGWERMIYPLNGGEPQQSTLQGGTVPEVGIRAGRPLSPIRTLQSQTTLDDPPETSAFPTFEWNAPNQDPNILYSAWGDQPSAIDFAFNSDESRVYFLTPTEILTYNLGTQELISSVPLDLRSVNPVGIHRLMTPIPIKIDSGGEEE